VTAVIYIGRNSLVTKSAPTWDRPAIST